MSAVRVDFCTEVSDWTSKHKILCACTLGLALLVYTIGNLGGRAVNWLRQCCGTPAKVEKVSKVRFAEGLTEEVDEKQRASVGLSRPNPDNFKVEDEVLGKGFWVLNNVTDQWFPLDAQNKPRFPCISKDKVIQRFPNIYCLSKGNIPEVENCERYLHANRFQMPGSKLRFVALQQPELIEIRIFWENVKGTIIDLTGDPEEPHCPVDKAPIFYKEDDNNLISVKLNTEHTGSEHKLKSENAELVSYHVLKKQNGIEQRSTVQRLAYNAWKDRKAIEVEELKILVSDVKQLVNKAEEDELWIHCTVGIGRTGTLIAALLIDERIEEIRSKVKNAKELIAYLEDLIMDIRNHRYYAVQTPVQYALLYNYTVDLLCNKK